MLLLCHTDEMLSPTYEKATNLMSYGRVENPTNEISKELLSYGRVDIINLISPMYEISSVFMSYG